MGLEASMRTELFAALSLRLGAWNFAVLVSARDSSSEEVNARPNGIRNWFIDSFAALGFCSCLSMSDSLMSVPFDDVLIRLSLILSLPFDPYESALCPSAIAGGFMTYRASDSDG